MNEVLNMVHLKRLRLLKIKISHAIELCEDRFKSCYESDERLNPLEEFLQIIKNAMKDADK